MTYAEPQNLTGIVEIFTYANSVSDNFYGFGIVLTLYFIVMLYLHNSRGEDLSDAAQAAGFSAATVAVFLLFMEVITSYQFFISLVLLTIPSLWTFMNRNN